jgi:putative redox protein
MTTIRTATLEHVGELDFRSVTGTGRKIDFGEVDQGYLSPVETLLVALGACTAMDVISIARKKRQRVDSYLVHVRGDQRTEYPQVFTEIDVVHEMTGPRLSEAAIRRSVELSATKYCPVSAMISAGATVVHHRYVIHSTGAAAYEAEGEVIATGPYARPDIIASPR